MTVSVIIPTYNRKAYVKEAIESVLAQTYNDCEIIVVDDGSTDGTGEVLQARYGNRIRYVWQENQGESIARSHGIELARGEFIALLDSDDLWLPGKLARQVLMLGASPGIGMVFCQAWIIDGHGQRIAEAPYGASLGSSDLTLEKLCFQNSISGPSTTLIRRVVFEQIGGFDPNIHFGEDWDFWLRMALHYQLAFIPEPLACVRRHRGTQSYYPSPERNAQRLADHLTVLEKAFASWPGEPSADLRHRAIAYQYAQAFLAEEAVGNTDAAMQDLLAAFQLAPDLLQDMDTFGKYLVNHAAIIAEQAGETGLGQAVDYAQRVLERVVALGIEDRAFEKRVTAAVHATLGFIAHECHGNRVARHHFLQAIRRDPSWLHNLGLLSIVAESFVGKHTMNSARRVAKWFMGGAQGGGVLA